MASKICERITNGFAAFSARSVAIFESILLCAWVMCLCCKSFMSNVRRRIKWFRRSVNDLKIILIIFDSEINAFAKWLCAIVNRIIFNFKSKYVILMMFDFFYVKIIIRFECKNICWILSTEKLWNNNEYFCNKMIIKKNTSMRSSDSKSTINLSNIQATLRGRHRWTTIRNKQKPTKNL